MKRAATICLLFFFAFLLYQPVSVSAKDTGYSVPVVFDYDREDSYNNYIANVEGLPQPSEAVTFRAAENYTVLSGDVERAVEYGGRSDVLWFHRQEAVVEWAVEVPAEGLYSLAIGYAPDAVSRKNVELTLSINGSIPFNEVRSNVFRRAWQDTVGITRDRRDNDVRPRQAIVEYWQEELFKDNSGKVQEELKFKFNAGRNIIRIETNGEPFALEYLKLVNHEPSIPYEQYLQSYAQAKRSSGEVVKVQAEDPYLKSDSSLYPVYDRTSPLTEPYDKSKIRLNTIGGTTWKENNQWIIWKVTVPEDGLYKIGIKYMQNILEGLFTSRRLYINGEVPFAEVDTIRFDYGTKWDMNLLGGEEPYYFYLKKGENEIKLENVLGEIAPSFENLETCVYELNEIYRRIIMITGTDPDTYRDYAIEKEIPEFSRVMTENAKRLTDEVERLQGITKKRGKELAFLERVAVQLNDLNDDPGTINTRLDSFKNNISSLGAWILKLQEQPLSLDYIVVLSPDTEPPVARANLWQGMKHGITMFWASFFEDYSLSGEDVEEKEPLKVWVNLGRDQASVISGLVNDYFTPETGIDVQLELVQGSLIEATLAGRGPDIALMVANDQPINFAIRNALVDLSQFPDFEEVSKRFFPSAFEPFKFRGAVYALPDSQSFEMMFYRKDIFAELGLGIPQTWEEFYRMVPVIQRKNMQIGLPPVTTPVNATSTAASNAVVPPTMFQTLLFQKHGRYYKDTLDRTAFDEEPAKEAFAELVGYYTKYDFPLTYDFYNRFRTGEMPLAIQAYTQFNMLSAAAPEIQGLWGMAPIPGTLQEDGTIDRSGAATMTASIMFEKGKDNSDGWEFMKWWSSADVQAMYGLELESLMGPSARYATANIEAFGKLPWSSEEYDSLMEQWGEVKAVPEVPGSYYTPRGLQNAFRTAVFDFENPYETLFKENKDINEEIDRKLNEFGLKETGGSE